MSLKKLFEEREKSYEQHTKKIIGSIRNVIGGINKSLDKDTVKFVEWKIIDIFDDELLFLVGFVEFPNGYEVKTPTGQTVQVNEQNKEALKRLVRISLPAQLAEQGSADEIAEFLKNRQENQFDESLSSVLDEPEESFSTEELTEEQLMSLRLYSGQTKDKLN